MRMHLSFLLTFLVLSWGSAWATPKTFSLDGRLYSKDSSSNPILDSQVTIKVQILNPAEDCVLYEESQVVNTQSTNGYFNIQVGSPVSGGTSSKRTSGDSGNSMSKVFSNSSSSISGKSLADLSNCTYAPVSGDQRYARISATPSSDQMTRVFSPNMTLDSVPNAVIAESAESLQGIAVNQFLQVNNSSAQLTQTNLEALFTGSSYTNLQNILSGSMTQAAGGKVGVGTATPATKLDVSGGIRLGDEPAACSASLSGTFRYNGGSMQFCNSSTWQTLGVSGGGITSLNGQAGVSQTFAAGTAGTAPAWSSGADTHTLNIPMASTGSVTAGLISNSDYTAFSNKAPAIGSASITTLGTITTGTWNGTAIDLAHGGTGATTDVGARSNLGLGTAALLNTGSIGGSIPTVGPTGITPNLMCTGDGSANIICNTAIPTGNALTGSSLAQFASTTSAELANLLSDETGTGAVVFGTSPTISSPTFTTNITTPMIVGGTGTTSTLTYKTTTGVGAVGADHIFQVGNNGATEAMRILNNGNVGVGTTSPRTGLDVYNGNSFLGTYQNPAIIESSNGLTYPLIKGADQAGIVMYGTNPGTNIGWSVGTTGSTPSFNIASMALSSGYPDIANRSNKFTIQSDGNVGIGTANPAATLDVKGSFKISGSTSGAVGFAVPAAAGSAIYTWPSAAPVSNKLLQSDSSGNLSWVAASGSGDALTGSSLAQFASTTSVELETVLSDETGTGTVVFGTSPTISSPTFTGTPLSPTAAADTNTTQIATTAFVVGQASSTGPVMDGTQAVGTSLKYARADHVHPTDTGRAPASGSASITTLGTITAGTWNSTAIGVAYGGTGATTDVGARSNLGLGTAAVLNTGSISNTIPTVGVTGITPNLMCTGDGVGAIICNTAIPIGNALTGSSLAQFTSTTTSAELANLLSGETGTGAVVFGTSPTFTTNITTPMIVGGTGTTSTLTYKTTTGVGAAGADHIFQVGNNGATEAMRILNNGNVGIGTTSPAAPLQVSTTNTATSGSISAMQIAPTYNQTSGTAANTDLLINRTQTAVGSGSQKLIDAQVGGVSKFSVDSAGNVTTPGSVSAAGNAAVRAYRATSFQTITPPGTLTKVQFNAENFDVKGEFNPTTNRYTALEGGIYWVSTTIFLTSAAPGETLDAAINVNGTAVARNMNFGNGLLNAVTVTSVVQLSVGDYVEIYVIIGAVRDIDFGSDKTYLSIVRMH